MTKPQWPLWTGVAAGTLGLAAISYGVASLFLSDSLPAGIVPPRANAVPFAKISGKRVWPVVSNVAELGQVAYTDIHGNVHGRSSRQFAAIRPNGRKHAGIDLFGNNGDPVVAMANGTVVATQTFNLGTDALLVAHDGAVVLYGELDSGSWKDYGIGVGSQVRAGDPIGRIGCMVGSWENCDSNMLHIETYVPGTTRNYSWSGQPPAALLDPTHLLLTASSAEANA
jgi:murein DD-endopeptidase MepM/ murein hydrolase activator NlpD